MQQGAREKRANSRNQLINQSTTPHLVGAFHGVGLLSVRDGPEEQSLRSRPLDSSAALHAHVDLIRTDQNASRGVLHTRVTKKVFALGTGY